MNDMATVWNQASWKHRTYRAEKPRVMHAAVTTMPMAAETVAALMKSSIEQTCKCHGTHVCPGLLTPEQGTTPPIAPAISGVSASLIAEVKAELAKREEDYYKELSKRQLPDRQLPQHAQDYYTELCEKTRARPSAFYQRLAEYEALRARAEQESKAQTIKFSTAISSMWKTTT